MTGRRRKDDISASQAGELAQVVFSLPFVSDKLCKERLGYSKESAKAALRYLKLPVAERPDICYFFDREFYQTKYADPPLTGSEDPFMHFMSMGCSLRRSPHPLVDPDFMNSIDPHVLQHGYGLNDLYEILYYGLVDPSAYFSVEFYRRQVTGL